METVIALIIKYKYLALFPVAAIEGPLVSLFVGFLIFTGDLDFIPAYTVLIFRDLITDTAYYYVGRFGNKDDFMNKYKSRFKLISNNFKLIENLWQHHARKTMFLGKLAYGLSIPFIISAGLIKMPFRKFISYTLPVTFFQYGLLILIGYYLGQSYNIAIRYVEYTGVIITIILLVMAFSYMAISKYAKKQIIRMEIESDTK